MLQAEARRNPQTALSGLIGEPSTRSTIFRTWCVAHNVRFRRTGRSAFNHPVARDLSLTFKALDLAWT